MCDLDQSVLLVSKFDSSSTRAALRDQHTQKNKKRERKKEEGRKEKRRKKREKEKRKKEITAVQHKERERGLG